ncbi:MAG: N-formylglutamate amidohydrolase [Caulobacteraceae bacterium]
MIVTNSGAACPFLFIGDHAGREIPRRLAKLGLGEADLERHIAWDIGVAGLGEWLAANLRACFIRQTYSRLVIDCNRTPGTEESIPQVSDGASVPGNAELTTAQRRARRAAIYQPYHDRIAAELDERGSTRTATVLVALHSFTPTLGGLKRPWRFGVLHRDDSPFSARMLQVMSVALGEWVGDNQPYAMDSTDNTVPLHTQGRAIDYLELEVRQDLIADAAGQSAAAMQIARFLRQAAEPRRHS